MTYDLTNEDPMTSYGPPSSFIFQVEGSSDVYLLNLTEFSAEPEVLAGAGPLSTTPTGSVSPTYLVPELADAPYGIYAQGKSVYLGQIVYLATGTAIDPIIVVRDESLDGVPDSVFPLAHDDANTLLQVSPVNGQYGYDGDYELKY